MDTLLYDLRYAARKLRHSPGFTIVAVATLGVAIGATTAMFSIVNSVLLNALPFAEPSRLVYVQSTDSKGAPLPVSPQDLIDYRARSRSFTDLVAMDGGESINLSRAGAPALRVTGARVGATFFSTLRVRPALGRTFTPGEDEKAAPKVVVLAYDAWRRYFGSDPDVVGKSVAIDGESFRVIGVADPTLTLPGHPDLWIPAVWASYEIGDRARGQHSIAALGRLKPGVTVDAARRELSAVAAELGKEYPQHDAKVGAYVAPLADQVVGNVRRPLWSLLGAVAFVLLIACGNVANLQLARVASRESELAVRSALGAVRSRVLRQLIVESLLLSAAGAVIGALLAAWIVSGVTAFGPARLPRLAEIGIDGRVLAVTCAITALAGLFFGLVPAVSIARTDVARVLRDGARGSSGGPARLRSTLIVAQLALTTVLLVGAGLLIRSFERLVNVDPGFRADHLIVFGAGVGGPAFQYDAQVNTFAANVLRRIQALPGVSNAAVVAARPLDANPTFGASAAYWDAAGPKPEPGHENVAAILPVSPSYFDVMKAPFVRGRAFTEGENRLDAAPVMVVNEALVRDYFKNENPIGRQIVFGISHNVTASPTDTVRVRGEIVGVVADERQNALSERTMPAAYVPFNTAPFATSFVVRTIIDPSSLARSVAATVGAVDRSVPVYELSTMDDAIGASVAQPRFYTALFGAFAAIALLLATLGIYGVIAYLVGQRTREFGIRLALGASSSDVARLVVGRGASLAIVGVALGAVGAVLLTRSIQALLFDTPAIDPFSFGAAALLMVGAALFAAWMPARRAARIDPAVAMRAE